jgi:hypothetical protein
LHLGLKVRPKNKKGHDSPFTYVKQEAFVAFIPLRSQHQSGKFSGAATFPILLTTLLPRTATEAVRIYAPS